ncbi:MAG: penicillin acylase family protein, partial [Alphaproteobacteria bacterium]|nr:penicillin acylase family protein [Alphaproteobacteria bacterium]
LSGNFEDEVYREALLKNGFSKAQIGAMYPAMDHDVPSTMKPLEWVKKRHEAQGIRHEGVLFPAISSNSIPMANSLWPNVFDHLPHTASNAYVIAGAHTKSGNPILANDPHLQLQSPILWYLARIVTPQGELKGATAAGLPFFPLGQNSHVAWGFTTSNIDVEDVTFISNDTKNFTTRHEIIHVKDGGDVTMDVAENNQGVILSDAMASVHDITPPNKKALLQFTGFDANDRTVEALFHINTAMNAAGIETALKDYSVPPQNLLYADDAGHTGYVAVGVIPKRSNDGFYASDNKMWQGVMAQTSDTAPRLKDPKAGVILTANQAIVDDKACAAFSCSFARDWAEPYRAMRMEEWFAEQFENKTMMDVTSASGAMLDMTSDAAKHFLPTLLQGANAKGGMQKDILAAISRWDGSMARDKPEPLIYHAWLDAIMRAQFGGQYTSDVLWPRMWALEHQAIRADVIQTAFNDALAGLQTKYGAAWQQWRWGSEHIAPLKHPLWSHVPVLNQLTSLATETDGDGYTLRRGAPLDYSKPFLAEHGAGYRGVYDVGNPAQSLFMIAGGESGQLLSPHYGNLRSEWSDGKFFTLTGDEAALMQNNASVLTLTP